MVALKKQSGFNQDFEFRCLGGKYQDLFFQSEFRDTTDFFKQNKQEKIRIPCLPTTSVIDIFDSINF